MLKVDDIRPDDLNEMKELAFLADKVLLKKHIKDFTDGLCPVCEKRSGKIVYEQGELVRYARCPIRNILYLDRHLPEDGYAEFYCASEIARLFSERIYQKSRINREKYIYIPRLRRLLDICKCHFPSGITGYCGIGAGSGQFAHLMKSSVFFSHIYAVEPSPSLAADCRSLGLETFACRVEDIDQLPTNLRVIASFECLELLVDPVRRVRKISKLLQINSLFIVSTPNSLGFDIIELGSMSTTLGITHIHLFNPVSLKKLFQMQVSVFCILAPLVCLTLILYDVFTRVGREENSPLGCTTCCYMVIIRYWMIFIVFSLNTICRATCGRWR